MKNFVEKQTQQKNAADVAALNERHVKPLEILQEIEPLIKEYFIGEFSLESNALKINLKNGQQFRLIAAEVC